MFASSVIVGDLDVDRPVRALGPLEADPPLVVDADAVLAFAVTAHVSKIKIEPAGMLSDAGMDYLLAAIKLRARFSRPVFDYPTNLNPTAAKW
jgi:hypothetical protein